MPKILLTQHQKQQYEVKKVQRELTGQMKDKKISQATMADILGISQPSFSYKLKNMSFSLLELMLVMERLDLKLNMELKK